MGCKSTAAELGKQQPLEDCDSVARQLFTPEQDDMDVGQHRMLETFRPMTREEATRKILENAMPEEGGLRDTVLAALFTENAEGRF